MTIDEFERFCWDTDGVRVVIRGSSVTQVSGFSRVNAVNKLKTISYYRDNIKDAIGNIEFVIIDGNGYQPNGNAKIVTIRNTYAHE